jgi:hypothetical protein
MGSSSSSSNETVSKSVNFNNIDYGDSAGGGGSGSLAKNINLSDSELSIGDVTATDHGAVAGALGFADNANARASDLVMELGDNAYDDVADSRDLTKDLFKGAVDSVNSSNREALQFLSQGTDRALAFATQSTRSESGQIAENLTKYVMIGGAGIVALVIFTRGK